MTGHIPAGAIAACHTAHQRLIATASAVDDETARTPSRLPGWTVGHLLTHLARNAESHLRRLEGALRGEDLARYAGGSAQRDREIEAGAHRPAADLAADLAESAHRLEAAFQRAEEAGWPNAHFLATDKFPVTGIPLRRLREVEIHHVDLGLGYEPARWSDTYVDWDLPHTLKRLPDRLSAEDARRLLGWLTGRADLPKDLELGDWM